MITLRTIQQDDNGTFGVLIMDAKVLCRTCEDPWRDNQKEVSCIPAGRYEVIKRVSQKYPHHWHVQNVPNRTLILIHNGNYTTDTEGCILVGEGFLYDKDRRIVGVSNSRPTMAKLRQILPDKFTLKVER